jgi:hypothetical protein
VKVLLSLYIMSNAFMAKIVNIIDGLWILTHGLFNELTHTADCEWLYKAVSTFV